MVAVVASNGEKMHKSTSMANMKSVTKESQDKSVQLKHNNKPTFLSPFAKEKSNVAYTGDTILRKKRVK